MKFANFGDFSDFFAFFGNFCAHALWTTVKCSCSKIFFIGPAIKESISLTDIFKEGVNRSKNISKISKYVTYGVPTYDRKWRENSNL